MLSNLPNGIEQTRQQEEPVEQEELKSLGMLNKIQVSPEQIANIGAMVNGDEAEKKCETQSKNCQDQEEVAKIPDNES